MLVYLAPRIRPANDVRRDLLFFRSAGMKSIIGDAGFEVMPARRPEGLPCVVHEADHLLNRLALSGIEVPKSNGNQMGLAITSDEQREADDWLRRNVTTDHASSHDDQQITDLNE